MPLKLDVCRHSNVSHIRFYVAHRGPLGVRADMKALPNLQTCTTNPAIKLVSVVSLV